VTTIEQDLRDDIARDQRRADLPSRGVATVQAIARRRHQLAFLVGVVTLGLISATLVSRHVLDVGGKTLIDADATRFALAAFSIWIVVYTFTKDRCLRRVSDEREKLMALDGEIATGLLSAGLVLDAVTAMHARLELDELLPCIVEQGRGLIGGDAGVLFVVESDEPMQPVVDEGNLSASVSAVADLAAQRRSVVGVVDGNRVDIAVPIVAGELLLGVLVLPGVVGQGVTEDTKMVMTRFSTAAGAALLNARRYEAAMFLLDVAH
jgi:GAF domain-containing protein